MLKIICVRISKGKMRSLFHKQEKFEAFIAKYRKLRLTENAYIKMIMKGTHGENHGEDNS